MPSKTCGSCLKLVYPMDELKCLDKVCIKVQLETNDIVTHTNSKSRECVPKAVRFSCL